MKLNYLIPDRFGKYDLNAVPSKQNPGGGMGTKAQRAIEAWSRFYDVMQTENIETCLADAPLVVEPLWFQYRGHQNLSFVGDIEIAVEAYERHQSKIKILYSTELLMLEIPTPLRHRIFKASSVVTTPCKWLSGIYEMQGIHSLPLCDPVPESTFYNPDTPKTLSIVAIGRISTDKNSEKVLEIFKALKDKPIKTIYIGGSDLWGHTNAIDSQLEREIRANCDEFHHNLSQHELATHLSSISCGIFDTYHDTGSESNLEACAAGIVSFYGSHGLWQERPGIHNLYTVQDFVDAIAKHTQDFTTPPAAEDRRKAETWALTNCSYNQFMKEWQEVLKYARA